MVKALKTLILASLIGVLMVLGGAMPAQATALPAMGAIPGFKSLFGGSRPVNLGIEAGHLAPCPGSANCVASQGNEDGQHAIAPLTYSGETADAMAALRQVIEAQPNTEIIEQTDNYLYAEFTSQLIGFVDDVEFYFPPQEPGIIHVRSASRLGESDLGVNRKRVEAIRAAFVG